MMNRLTQRSWLHPVAAAAVMVCSVHAAAPGAPASAAEAPAAAKDVVRDTASGSGDGRVVPTPPRAAMPAAAAPIHTSPMHDAATAGALGDLGLALLQQQSRMSGQAEVNAVLSPLSVAVATGMLHAGAASETARELALLLSSGPAGPQGFAARLPSVLARIAPAAGAEPGPLAMASRIWLRKDVVAEVPGPYADILGTRFAADGAALSFNDAESARRAINAWTSNQTRGRIDELLPAGSVTPATRAVVTNAVHFRSRWAEPFDIAETQVKPFHTAGGVRQVPTLSDERAVLQGTVDNLSVFELPFAGKTYSLMLAMAPKGHTLNALENDLAGLDMASWSAQLKESTCRFEMPRFAIRGAAASLKEPLKALGVRRVFTDQAELQPMLGKAAAGTFVDDVFHAATIVIDEQGGEATAATAATAQAKSFRPPAPTCAVDRPFVFAVVHKATGAPVFIGKVADPSQASNRP